MTVGGNGVRDTEHPCTMFTEGTPAGTCNTDGHYLCRECVHAVPFCTGCDYQPAQCECEERAERAREKQERTRKRLLTLAPLLTQRQARATRAVNSLEDTLTWDAMFEEKP